MKKKYIIMSLITILVLILVVIAIKFLDKKEEPKKNIEVSVIETIVPLETSNSSQASELIKSNIVKVINKIDKETNIIGTGFFDKSGYLVTNSHIVDIKGEISIEYYDGTTSDAILFSNDITSDIALLAVSNPKAKAMYYGDTLSLNITDDVYAIGYPFALKGEASVTKGILSARRSAGTIGFLQSDISLNTGNSGGPLINDKAHLLGINTYATENASIGMSISSESLQSIIKELIESKTVNYLEEERPSNALSVVLNEIGHKTKDLYNESKYFKRTKINKITQDEETKENKENNKNKDNENNKNRVMYRKDSGEIDWINYEINVNKDLSIGYLDDVPSNIDYYFNVNDNNDCKLDLDGAKKSTPGKYNIKVTCPNASASTTLTIKEKKKITIPSFTSFGMTIPELVIDETYYNVTDEKELEGDWYMPGYNDLCVYFYKNYEDWFYTETGMVYWKGEIHGSEGGGGGFTLNKYEYYWITGKYLIVTNNNKSYVYTREQGTKSYYGNGPKSCSPYM